VTGPEVPDGLALPDRTGFDFVEDHLFSEGTSAAVTAVL